MKVALVFAFTIACVHLTHAASLGGTFDSSGGTAQAKVDASDLAAARDDALKAVQKLMTDGNIDAQEGMTLTNGIMSNGIGTAFQMAFDQLRSLLITSRIPVELGQTIFRFFLQLLPSSVANFGGMMNPMTNGMGNLGGMLNPFTNGATDAMGQLTNPLAQPQVSGNVGVGTGQSPFDAFRFLFMPLEMFMNMLNSFMRGMQPPAMNPSFSVSGGVGSG